MRREQKIINIIRDLTDYNIKFYSPIRVANRVPSGRRSATVQIPSTFWSCQFLSTSLSVNSVSVAATPLFRPGFHIWTSRQVVVWQWSSHVSLCSPTKLMAVPVGPHGLLRSSQPSIFREFLPRLQPVQTRRTTQLSS